MTLALENIDELHTVYFVHWQNAFLVVYVSIYRFLIFAPLLTLCKVRFDWNNFEIVLHKVRIPTLANRVRTAYFVQYNSGTVLAQSGNQYNVRILVDGILVMFACKIDMGHVFILILKS